MRHNGWIAGGLIALVTASLVGCGSRAAEVRTAGNDTGPAKEVQTLTVAEQTVPEWLEATGSVRSKFEATLAAKIMARVATVSVRE
ncbi:MAG TPA: hypothetical protein DER07_09500, partial [Armatimonadetes bacterium]|nr:hypothetical protein [Armatimonadota bacterium]